MTSSPTVLVLGGNGQLGQELLRAMVPLGTVLATTRSGRLPDGRPCEAADFGHPDSLTALLDNLQPAIVVNAAAYTAVDTAEQDVAAAFTANAVAPGVIARWCAARGVPFVHYSSDYVFDGQGAAPYREDDATAPLSIYGASKRDGEDAVREAGGRHLIFRTSWVYAARGSNFLRTMLQLGAERNQLRVVADQIGAPTSATLIADITARALQHPGRHSGTWHLSAKGQTSWYGFARAIFAEAEATGMLRQVPLVIPIPAADFAAKARRPAWSVLDTRKLQHDFGEVLPEWHMDMRRVMAEIRSRQFRD